MKWQILTLTGQMFSITTDLPEDAFLALLNSDAKWLPVTDTDTGWKGHLNITQCVHATRAAQ